MSDDDLNGGGILPEVSELDLANSLAASEEAMRVLGSALARHVVGALQAQGLIPAQTLGQMGRGGQYANFAPTWILKGWALVVSPPIFRSVIRWGGASVSDLVLLIRFSPNSSWERYGSPLWVLASELWPKHVRSSTSVFPL